MQYFMLNQMYKTAIIDVDFQSMKCHMLKILDKEHLPFLLKMSDENTIDRNLTRFIMHRLIPEDRIGIGRLYIELGADRLKFSMDSYGETMTDPFWFKTPDDDKEYKDINFHYAFSQNTGNFISYQDLHIIDTCSPDLTTNGRQRKIWRKDKTEYLLKYGTFPHYLEPFNEVAASNILKRIDLLPFVDYELLNINGEIVSRCDNFLQQGEEFVPACDIYHSSICEPLDKDIPLDIKLIKKCEALQIYGVRDFLYRLRFFDFITGNKDRHLGNFGFIYNHNLNAFTGPAPVFDNGEAISGDELIVNLSMFKKELKSYHPYCKMPEIELESGIISHYYKERGEELEQKIINRISLFEGEKVRDLII